MKLLCIPDYSQPLCGPPEIFLQYKSIHMKRILFIPLLVLLASCQPTKITQSWVAKDVIPKKYKKVLVLAVLPDNENELRTKIENHLADDLRELGYLALPSNKVFPTGTFIKGDTVRATTAIEGKGFDAILTIVLLDKKKERYYVPGKISEITYQGQPTRFDNYYSAITERTYIPGYYGEETKYMWENNFYDLYTKKMIYSARSRSFDIASKNTLAHTYGMLMAQSLVEKNILLKPEAMEE